MKWNNVPLLYILHESPKVAHSNGLINIAQADLNTQWIALRGYGPEGVNEEVLLA